MPHHPPAVSLRPDHSGGRGDIGLCGGRLEALGCPPGRQCIHITPLYMSPPLHALSVFSSVKILTEIHPPQVSPASIPNFSWFLH